jgi:hypothetical protein
MAFAVTSKRRVPGGWCTSEALKDVELMAKEGKEGTGLNEVHEKRSQIAI